MVVLKLLDTLVEGEKMEAIIKQIKEAIASAVQLIKTQKETIVSLKQTLSEMSQEYAQSLEQEAKEDADAELMMKQLEDISKELSNVVEAAQ